MSPNKLRVVHALAESFSRKETKSAPISDFYKVPYDQFKSFPDLISYLQKFYGATNLPGEKHWNLALRVFEENSIHEIEMIAITDSSYPKYLRKIDNPPPVLYIRGNRSIFLDLPGVSVVGTREVSENGKIITKRISQHLAERGWVIVSGLARGVDAIAHEACLDVKGKTIAVLANGLDEPQPKQNSALGYRILESGGAWVSEHPVGTAIEKHYFVQRNRIQLGLSAGSVIIEAAVKSGTMTQAQYCVKQNRPLFAVVPETPENVLRLNSEGTLEMVKSLGAIPIKSRNDYLSMNSLLEEQRSMMHSLPS